VNSVASMKGSEYAKSQFVRCRYGLVLSAEEGQVSPTLARARHQGGQRTTSNVAAMKFTITRPYADPETAARKIIEIANSVEAVQDGRIFIEPGRYCLSTRPRRRNIARASSW
jgi:hypothetical protein